MSSTSWDTNTYNPMSNIPTHEGPSHQNATSHSHNEESYGYTNHGQHASRQGIINNYQTTSYLCATSNPLGMLIYDYRLVSSDLRIRRTPLFYWRCFQLIWRGLASSIKTMCVEIRALPTHYKILTVIAKSEGRRRTRRGKSLPPFAGSNSQRSYLGQYLLQYPSTSCHSFRQTRTFI